MSTTRGVLFVHSAPSALCPHVEWAVGGVFGAPVRVDWVPQPVERSTYRFEYPWTGPTGTAARLASALKGWQRLRFEVTEDATLSTDAHRYAYTPSLGVFHALTSRNGEDGVFLLGDDGSSVTWRAVQRGIQQGGRVQLRGATFGGRVVVLGQQLLDDGTAVRVTGDEARARP